VTASCTSEDATSQGITYTLSSNPSWITQTTSTTNVWNFNLAHSSVNLGGAFYINVPNNVVTSLGGESDSTPFNVIFYTCADANCNVCPYNAG